MTAIRITTFQGLRPRTNARLIGDTNAQVASNCDLRSGVLAPVFRPKQEYAPNKPLPAKTLFRAVEGNSAAWLTWPFDVDAVKMPMPAGVAARFAWTGDGEPRWGKYSNVTNGGGNDYPAQFYALGIPNPTAKPTATPSGGLTNTVTRFYCYTFFSQDGEESGPSPVSDSASGYSDATWAITGMSAFPVSSGSAVAYFSTNTLVVSIAAAVGTITGATNAGPIVITETAHGRANGSLVNISGVVGNTAANNTYANPYWIITTIDANTYSLNGSVGNGVYTSGGSVRTVTPHWSRVGDEAVLSSTTLAVTATPTAYTFNVAGDYSAATSWARKAPWNTSGMKRRLYRTAGTAAGFQLVHDDVGTSYNDTLSDAAIMGDEMVSDGWKPPPPGLKGLCVTAFGSLAGFIGTELRLSEPYQGHAWPDAYAYRTGPDIVAIAPMGNAVGIGTEGVPYVLIGSDPAAMAPISANAPYPCLAKRSMVSDGGGVIFSSTAGLVRLDQSAQPMVFSDPWFDQKTWALKEPASIVCAIAPGRLYAVYTAGGRTSIMVWDMTIGELTENAIDASDVYVDESTGEVYIGDSEGVSSMVGGQYTAQLVWRSKEFVLTKPENMGVAKVRFSAAIDETLLASILAKIADATAFNEAILLAGDIGGSFNVSPYNALRWNGSLFRVVPEVPPSNTVTFTLFADGVEKFTKVVSADTVFKLPSGYMAGRVSVQVSSACEITGIEMAGTAAELARV